MLDLSVESTNFKCGDKVEVKEGDFKGSVGVIRKITEITKVNIQIDFIGSRKTLTGEILQKVGSMNRELTPLVVTDNEEKKNG